MSEYTLGPWEVRHMDNDEECKCFEVMKDCWFVATTHDGVESNSNAEANAHLIAAAPDLLDALKELCEIVEDAIGQRSAKDLDSFTLQPARAAIARAQGEAK